MSYFSRENVKGGLLAMLGALTLATGLFFLFLRPAMLPEDQRFVGVTAGQQPAQMVEWLGIVFRTWGAFIAGFGILLIGIGAFLITQKMAFLEWGTAVAISIGFGRFLMSNIILASDFVIFVGGLFALALVVAFLLVLPSRHTRNRRTPHP